MVITPSLIITLKNKLCLSDEIGMRLQARYLMFQAKSIKPLFVPIVVLEILGFIVDTFYVEFFVNKGEIAVYDLIFEA